MTAFCSPRQGVALLALPVLFVVVLFVMGANSQPFWQVFNLDPDYYYLLNGLRLVESLPPTDISHPGTPVQVLIAAVIRLMHVGEPTGAVVDAVLGDPERHLAVVTWVMYPLIGLALVGLGYAFQRATGRLEAGLLAQSAPFLSMIIPKFGLHPKPEGFLVIAVPLLVIAALAVAKADRPSDRHVGWLGLAIGFAIACKLHALALGLVPVFLLDRRRLFLVLPLATIAGFLISVSPVLPSYDIFFDWWGKVLSHRGAYGTGEAGVVDVGHYPRAIKGLFGSKLLFTVVLAASLLALAGYARLRRRGLVPADPLARLLAGMVLAQLATVLIVAKQSAAHYMVPAVLLTGPELAILFHLSTKVFPAAAHRRVWAVLAVVLVGVTVPAVWKQNAELARWTRDAQAFDMGRFAACAKVDYDSSSSLTYAFLRGDMNALGRYSPKLALISPKDRYTWFINDHSYWSHGFRQWDRSLEIGAVLAGYPCAVFRGNQPYRLLPTLWAAIPGYRPDDRCEVGEETVFTKGVMCDGGPVPLAK